LALEKIIEVLASNFGNDLVIKLVNFPNNLICVSASFTIVGIYIAPIPNVEKPSYIVLYLVFFDNELRPYLCKAHNIGNYSRKIIDEKVKEMPKFEKSEYYPFEKRFKSSLKTGKLFCFSSPIINVGEYFFYEGGNDNLFNKREDLKVVKELGLGSSWLNTSYSAISRRINLYGPSYLEMKRGDFLNDNIYAAIGSEYSLNMNYNNNILIVISFISLSLLIVIFIINVVTSDLLEPVKLLMIGAKLASKSDYSFRIISDRNDELGILCNSFNKMMKGLEEKLLMNSMVSKTALSVTANIEDFSSKKENVFLLYVTVPEFDKIMKENSTLELFCKLRNQISTIAKIILMNGGDIDKIMGEKLLIVFHINEKRLEDVAYAACNAAKCIENNENLDFKVSVGVNYGQVISGFLGVGEKRDFTVIGDPVNVTARIAVFAEKLESSRRIVSEQVMKIAKNNVKTEEYGEILFKGKSLPSKVYRIV
jgi:class 3 adenylate cyclase